MLKFAADRAFCEGLNRITYHGFCHSPPEAGYPGRTYHAGYDLNPRVTWWELSRPFFDYLARCSYMLQQGQFVADVAYFYGDQAPNFWPEFHDVPEKPLLEGLGEGYDYDVVNTDVILHRMSVRDGRIVLPDGMSYHLLALREQAHMPLEVLQKIAALVKAGATVVGPKPTHVPGLHQHEEKTRQLRKLADALWAPGEVDAITRRHGEGRVIWGKTPRKVLEEDGVGRDFYNYGRWGTPKLDFIHRRAGEIEIYMVRNRSATQPANSQVCIFRVFGKRPYLWDPVDASVRPAHHYREGKEGTNVPLRLPPGGSLFVIFQPEEDHLHAQELYGLPDQYDFPVVTALSPDHIEVETWLEGDRSIQLNNGKSVAISIPKPFDTTVFGDWKVEFPEGWGIEKEEIFSTYDMNARDQAGAVIIRRGLLRSWTEHRDDNIKHFSGTATYTKTIEIPEEMLTEDRRLYLDLGEVRDIARVRLNGHDLGIVWCAPFRVHITDVAVAGENALEIEITNMWINRLTGDMDLPQEQRFTSTNQTPPDRDMGGDEPWKVEPSGLLGPVRLVATGVARASLNPEQ